MNNEIRNPVEIDETALESVNGGLLLPAVQKVREAAARMSCATGYQGTTTVNQGILTAK